ERQQHAPASDRQQVDLIVGEMAEAKREGVGEDGAHVDALRRLDGGMEEYEHRDRRDPEGECPADGRAKRRPPPRPHEYEREDDERGLTRERGGGEREPGREP